MSNVIVPTLGQFGLVADQPAHELPNNAWSRVVNMRMRGGSAERFGGHQLIFDAPSVTPYHLVCYEVLGTRYVVHCGLSAIYADDGSSRSNITGTAPTGTAADTWTSAVLGGVLVLNNGVDSPMYWGGTGTLATLPGWDASWKCGSLRSYREYLVAWGITKGSTSYPHMVKWSHPAEPGAVPTSWDETDATKEAGEDDQADTTDQAVDQLPLGDMNVLYKQRSMYAMRWIGGIQIFEFRRIPGSYGMLAKNCAANTPKGHAILANGDIVLFDGVNEPQSIATDRIRSWLFKSQIDSSNYSKCFVVANPPFSEVWFCYPEVGKTTCTAAVVWNWDSNTWGRRQLPNLTHATSGVITYSAGNSWASKSGTTWAQASSKWNQNEFGPTESRLLMASTTPAVYIADSGNTFAGTAMASLLERSGLAFDSPETNKLLRSVIPRVAANTGTQLYITFGYSMDAEQPPTWGSRIAYSVGTTYKADGFASGRFLAIRIESDGGPKWAVKSYTADIVPRGPY